MFLISTSHSLWEIIQIHIYLCFVGSHIMAKRRLEEKARYFDRETEALQGGKQAWRRGRIEMIVQTKTYEPIEFKNLSRFEFTLEGHCRESHFERYFVYMVELNHLDPTRLYPLGFNHWTYQCLSFSLFGTVWSNARVIQRVCGFTVN